jgi:hypothetical protein
MRKTGTHEEVIKAFVNGEDAPYEGHNVFFEENILYSYGAHFALAVRLPKRIIINGDKTSASTSKHQSILQRYTSSRDNFTTSFSALDRWIG